MIDPLQLTAIADQAQHLLDQVDGFTPPLDDGELLDLSAAAVHQRRPLVTAGLKLDEAIQQLRAASSPAPLHPRPVIAAFQPTTTPGWGS